MKFCCKILLSLSVLFLFSCKDSSRSSESFDSKNQEKKGMKTPNLSEKNLLIADGRVGEFIIGDPIPKTSETYQIEKNNETRYTDDGPVEETVFIFSQNGNEQIKLKADESSVKPKIGEIWIFPEEFKTKEGIGVGSTLKEFTAAYPNYKLWYTYVSDRYVIENSETDVQFILNESDFIGNKKVDQVKVPLKISDFQPNSKISKIRIYRE